MMNKTFSFTLGAAAFAFVGLQACSSTSSPADDGGTVDDTDAATEASTTPDAAPDGGACDIAASTDPCDMCAAASCCSQEDTCLNEPADDAGMTECAEVFSCVSDCTSMDGGTFEMCQTDCAGAHSNQAASDFAGLATCLQASCASQCN
ncbi:MAG TPA: hypothetical protein VH044_14520 [Polyangiaceae bacterium]|jgi:hypothetical protein|nr:hypothetical protein [Polyangiaceae bacterium]